MTDAELIDNYEATMLVSTPELKRIIALARRQAEWNSRIGTHMTDRGCYRWGPNHYACALARIKELEEKKP